MKIATWNVNSLRVRVDHVRDWLTSDQPDVLALQETKLTDHKFPVDVFEELGYHSTFSGQPTYNGVAVLSKEPVTDIVTDFDGYDDIQRRILGVTVGGVRVLNLYIPNGHSVGSEKYEYKLGWLDALLKHLRSELDAHEKIYVVEQNRDSQLKSLMRLELKLDDSKTQSILHYNGLPMTPGFVIDAVNADLSRGEAA